MAGADARQTRTSSKSSSSSFLSVAWWCSSFYLPSLPLDSLSLSLLAFHFFSKIFFGARSLSLSFWRTLREIPLSFLTASLCFSPCFLRNTLTEKEPSAARRLPRLHFRSLSFPFRCLLLLPRVMADSLPSVLITQPSPEEALQWLVSRVPSAAPGESLLAQPLLQALAALSAGRLAGEDIHVWRTADVLMLLRRVTPHSETAQCMLYAPPTVDPQAGLRALIVDAAKPWWPLLLKAVPRRLGPLLEQCLSGAVQLHPKTHCTVWALSGRPVAALVAFETEMETAKREDLERNAEAEMGTAVAQVVAGAAQAKGTAGAAAASDSDGRRSANMEDNVSGPEKRSVAAVRTTVAAAKAETAKLAGTTVATTGSNELYTIDTLRAARATPRDSNSDRASPSSDVLSSAAGGDAELINTRWTYGKTAESLVFIQHLLQHTANACARPLTPVGAPPVAWVLQQDYGSVGMLYTEPGHRRRGLGRRVLCHLAHRLLEERATALGAVKDSSDVDLTALLAADGAALPPPPFAYIVEGNTASEALFAEAGFARMAHVDWYFVGKPNSTPLG